VTAPTASSHLSRLVGGHLLVMERQGRCHYYRLASAEVARAIEGLMTVASAPDMGWPPNHRVPPALREARMCYDHIAGRLGVTLANALREHDHVEFGDDAGLVTPAGEAFFGKLGVDLSAARSTRRPPQRRVRRHRRPEDAGQWPTSDPSAPTRGVGSRSCAVSHSSPTARSPPMIIRAWARAAEGPKAPQP